MPSKKGKKAGGDGKKKAANTPKSSIVQAGPSKTVGSSSTAVPQQAWMGTVVAPTPVAQDPLLAQASSVCEQPTRSSGALSETMITIQSTQLVEEAASEAAVRPKGKERAIDAAVDAPTIELLDIMSARALAGRVRDLKIRATFPKSHPVVCSLTSKSELDSSAADKNLKDRARRMEKIQQRTLAENPDMKIRREDAEIFTERLLASQQAYDLCRSYAHIMRAHDTVFRSGYAWGWEELFNAEEEPSTTSHEPGLENHEWRWQALTSALRQRPEYEKLKTAVDKDFGELGGLMQKDNVRAAVDQIIQHPEYAKFRADNKSGGLIVHAYDADYREKSKSQTKALQKIWRGRLRSSAVSGFPHRFLTAFKGDGIVLIHVAGFENTYRPHENSLSGRRGLFRSLCNQIIAQRPCMKGLKLTRLTNDMLDELKKQHITGAEALEELKTPRVLIDAMFILFRDLILDFAEMGVRKKWPTRDVVVIIDGIDWFEFRPDPTALPTLDAIALVREYKGVVDEHGVGSAAAQSQWNKLTLIQRKVLWGWMTAEVNGEQPDIELLQGELAPRTSHEAWMEVVAFFRGLADECNSSDLGKQVRFQYILLSPLSSRMGADPHVTERFITLDKDL